MNKRQTGKGTEKTLAEPSEEPLDTEEEGELEEGDEDEAPRVVVGRLKDLEGYGDAAVRKKYGERPVWFLIEDDADLIELFVRFPEKPIPARTTQDILGSLRAFAAAESDALQEVLGPTDAIGFGFHENASLDDVVGSFED